MAITDAIGSFLGNLGEKLHFDVKVLSGNKTENSPSNKEKVKLTSQPKSKTTYKKSPIAVDNSTHTDNSKVDNSVHIHNTFVLQVQENSLETLATDDFPAELMPLVDAYKDKQLALIAAPKQIEVNAILAFEEDPQIKSLLKFFSDKLASRDFILLRTGLFLGHLRKTNPKKARTEWQRIQQNSSPRDRKVINLAGADYFQDYFRPLYKTLSETSGDPAGTFKHMFETIVNDMHFVVFVNTKNPGDIIAEVVKKAKKNIRYGVSDKIIYVHAAGTNVQTLEEALPELKKVFPEIKRKRDQNMLKLSVHYKNNHLDELQT